MDGYFSFPVKFPCHATAEEGNGAVVHTRRAYACEERTEDKPPTGIANAPPYVQDFMARQE